MTADEFTRGELEDIDQAVSYAYRMEYELSKKGTHTHRVHHQQEARRWSILLEHIRKVRGR